MAIISCPECNKEVSDTSKKCIHCGYKLKKGNKRLKIVILISALVVIIITALILLITALSVSPAEKTVKQFIDYFKQENFYEMGKMSDQTSSELIYEYTGVNIINYTIKSVSDDYKIKHEIDISKYDFYSEDSFDFQKELYKQLYPDYEIILDTDAFFLAQSSEPILSEYHVNVDMEYSNFIGDIKRNSVSFTIMQKEPGSKEYIVTNILGINNSIY